jgi:hypothetical protein
LPGLVLDDRDPPLDAVHLNAVRFLRHELEPVEAAVDLREPVLLALLQLRETPRKNPHGHDGGLVDGWLLVGHHKVPRRVSPPGGVR